MQSYTGIKGTYKSLKRQGSLYLRDRINILTTNLNISSNGNASNGNEVVDKNKNASTKLTASEMQRNIGSVTFFLKPNTFEENIKSRTYFTNELWLPIKDITCATSAKLSVSRIKLNLNFIKKIFKSNENFSN
jgi:hypothetical protein